MMNANEEKDKEIEQSKQAVSRDAKGLVQSLRTFVVELLDFRGDTDRDSTIEAIKNDIPFKGATAWILVCSIFVASVGLNANSTAVVIGAMLISPLMGPILGIGLSIAINDIFTLRKSLVNFGVMVLLSVLTAFFFFLLFPLREESSELLARTQPDIRDVLIAFFGGLALIIARTKRGTIASVIFGVAIATALMPPLCTVGYGLAEGVLNNTKGWKFAWGAMYLFIINTIFIALATFLVLKLLRFPMIKYANSARRKNVARFASFLALLVMIPAGFTFYRVIQESTFKNSAIRYIDNELGTLPNADYIRKNAVYKFKPDSISTIELTTFGTDQISEGTTKILREKLQRYNGLDDALLVVNQSGIDFSFKDKLVYMEQLRQRDSLDLLTSNQKINFLNEKVSELNAVQAELNQLKKDEIPFKEVYDKAEIICENLRSLSYSKTYGFRSKKIDTTRYFTAVWSDSASRKTIAKEKVKLYEWLKKELNVDTLILN